uniref:Uncharacterized protein n=1 Tax=Globodera rostochiensis TaxID=31243 RepID=A0A914IDC1_GLORO
MDGCCTFCEGRRVVCQLSTTACEIFCDLSPSVSGAELLAVVLQRLLHNNGAFKIIFFYQLGPPTTIFWRRQRQLRIAETGYLKAAQQLGQLCQIIEKGVDRVPAISMRDDGAGGGDLNAPVRSGLSNIGNGCLCNGTAILIQQVVVSLQLPN